VAAAAALAIALAPSIVAVTIWGVPWHSSSSEQVSHVLKEFVAALRQKDFASACGALASSAPAMRAGTPACPSRVGRGFGRFDWGVQLPSTSVHLDGGENGHVYASVFADGGFLDGGPEFHFVLARERGAWRIQHIGGFF
jgi:hypothetical protein